MSRRNVLLSLAALVSIGLAVLFWRLHPPRVAVPAQGLELTRVHVVNPTVGRATDRRVVVRGGRIETIEPARGGAADTYAGAFALPGLVDLHVHHPPVFAIGERELYALLFLAHGVTSVRDAGGWWPATLRRHRDRIAAGRIPGPRVFQCGRFVDGEPPWWPGSLVATDAALGRAAVRELAEAGADCVKIYNQLRPDALRGVLEAAERHGLPVVGHVPWSVGLDRLRGVEVQHLMGSGRSWQVMDETEALRYARVSRERRIRHTPTLVAFAQLARAGEPEAWHSDPAAQRLPRYYRDVLWNLERNPLARGQFRADGGAASARLAAMQRIVAALHAEDVPVLAGSDVLNPGVVPGAALHQELHLLVEAGLTPEEAWAAATWRSGEALGAAPLGRLEPGAPADLLLFREDPTRDLAALSTLEAVVADGRLYTQAELDAALERARSHFASSPYEPLSMAAARAALAWLGAR